MTGRERIEAAFSPRGTPEVPAVICYEGLMIRDHWDELTDCPWWYLWEPDIERQLAWRRDMYGRLAVDWMGLGLGHSPEDRRNIRIEPRPDGAYTVDRRTGQQTRMDRPEVGGSAAHYAAWLSAPPPNPQSKDHIDKALSGPTGPTPDQVVAEGRADMPRAVIQAFPHLFPITALASPIWRCWNLWGFEGFMTMVALRPELVAHACDRYADRSRREIELAAAIGARGIWIEECWSDMIGPAALENVAAPSLRKVCDCIRRAGLASIYYYCGDPTDRWETLFGVGADAVSLEEGKKHFAIEIEEVVRRGAGRAAVLGNVDAIHFLPTADESQLRRELARQIAAGRKNGGRFIMSLGSPVTPATTLAQMRRYCDLTHELGGAKGDHRRSN